jgi:hypothetical protein
MNSISREPYWHNSAADLFAGLLMSLYECAQENEIHLKSLRTLRAQAFRGGDSPFIKENFLNDINKSTFAFSLLSGSVEVCNETRSCIVSTFDQAMRAFFSQDSLIDMLSGSDFDMRSVGREKTAVFLIVPDENTVYHKLVSVFVKQCYSELIVEAQKHPGKKLPRRVNFLLDEFASLPAISDFPAMITASRSRNIRFNLIVQSLNQLKEQYGVSAETIKGNCENWIYMHSRELPLLEELVGLAGAKNSEGSLLTVSMLQTLDKNKGEALVFHKRLHPFIANLKDIDEYNYVTQNKKQVSYPKNNRKATEIFDFEKFCKRKSSVYLSLLFSGKTPQEISQQEDERYLMMLEDDGMLEPIFTSKVPSDSDIENYFDNNENQENQENAELNSEEYQFCGGVKMDKFLLKLSRLTNKYGFVIQSSCGCKSPIIYSVKKKKRKKINEKLTYTSLKYDQNTNRYLIEGFRKDR